MTNRERFLAAFHQQEVDRFPVWLKMANSTWQSAQPEPYRSMGEVEVLQKAHSDVLIGNGYNVQRVRPHVEVSTEQEGDLHRTICHTPDGDLVGESRVDPVSGWHPTRFIGESAVDFPKLRWLYSDTTYEAKPDAAEEVAARQSDLVAQDIVTIDGIGPSPYMALVEEVCGPTASVYHMVDMPELFREIIALMHEDHLRELRARLPHVKADTFWLTENTSTSLISPDQFREFCVPHLRDYGHLVLEYGIVPVHHMCGTLNALLEEINDLPALVNEAYTTRPLGNVSLTEGRTRMPSKALMGGTNATTWMSDEDTIIQSVADDLATCPNRRGIILTSAGVLPPCVSMGKATRVVDALKAL